MVTGRQFERYWPWSDNTSGSDVAAACNSGRGAPHTGEKGWVDSFSPL